VAERGAEACGELGLPEFDRGEGRSRLRGVVAAAGGGNEPGCPARAPGPAEQETDEGRRPEGPREEGHLPGRPPHRRLLQHPRHRRQHVPHRRRAAGRRRRGGGARGERRRREEWNGLCGLWRGLKGRNCFGVSFFPWEGVGSLEPGHGAWTIVQ
jgi:hypothetical protein